MLLQLCLHSQLNTWLQWVGQRQQQDETRNICVLGLGVTYIRELTVRLFCKLAVTCQYEGGCACQKFQGLTSVESTTLSVALSIMEWPWWILFLTRFSKTSSFTLKWLSLHCSTHKTPPCCGQTLPIHVFGICPYRHHWITANIKHYYTHKFYQTYSYFISKCLRTVKLCYVCLWYYTT